MISVITASCHVMLDTMQYTAASDLDMIMLYRTTDKLASAHQQARPQEALSPR